MTRIHLYQNFIKQEFQFILFSKRNEKDKKGNDNEVCGCPLPKSTNVIEDSETEICLAPKRSCSLHFKWEKMRRAHIDLEKLRTVSQFNLIFKNGFLNFTS